MTLFSNTAFRAGVVLSTVFFLGVAPFFFALSLYLQVGLGFDALHAGLTTFPFALGSGFASARSDAVAKRLGRRQPTTNWQSSYTPPPAPTPPPAGGPLAGAGLGATAGTGAHRAEADDTAASDPAEAASDAADVPPPRADQNFAALHRHFDSLR